MKKVILFLIIGFVFINCSALNYGGCDYSVVSRMKSIVSNINMVYDYKIINNEVYFSVTLTNLTDDIYFYDSQKQRNYYYSDTNNGEITIYDYITSGSYKFYSNNASCKGINLGSKFYKFPEYNVFYTDSLCSDIPNYSLCQKWVNVNYSRSEFEYKVLEYKNSKQKIEDEIYIEYEKNIIDKIVEIYVKYYYYFLGSIIILLILIIIISDKKNKFKL